MDKHPHDDPNLPSYIDPAVQMLLGDLQMVQHVWNNLKGVRGKYLPKEHREPQVAYKNRLGRARFDNRFAPTIRANAGLLGSYSLHSDTPESITQHLSSIDGTGTDLKTFLTGLDQKALRDGGVGVMVEQHQPVDDDGQPLDNAAQFAAAQIRPYLVAVDRRDILSFSYMVSSSGAVQITRVVIRELRRIDDGLYGSRLEQLYRVLYTGGWEVQQLRKVGNSWTASVIEQGLTNLDQIPFCWYTLTGDKPFEGDLSFLNLAELNIEHFQKRSGLNEVLHKCNLPVPVRRGFIGKFTDLLSDAFKKLGGVALGPNTLLDIPKDGDFFFAEPSGSAISATQDDIERLEKAMDRVSLASLTGGEVQRTATEAMLDAAQAEAVLSNMAARKASCVERMFMLWGLYTGDPLRGGIEMQQSVLQMPPAAADVQTILDAMGMQISHRLGLQMLLAINWLPAHTDINAEAALIAGEEPVDDDQDAEV